MMVRPSGLLRPLVLGKGADRDQPLPDPHRDQHVEPDRDTEAIGNDRQYDRHAFARCNAQASRIRSVALADLL